MAEKLYDLEALNVLVDRNEKFKRNLIELFNQTTPAILEDIQKSYTSKDWNGLYSHLHKIKPTIESMGIHSMKPLIHKMMEKTKNVQDSEKLGQMLTEFCRTIEVVIEQLKTNEL